MYIESIHNIGNKSFLYLTCNRINSFVETEKRNSQCEQGQPMEQTRGLFCMWESGVACCRSQHQCNCCLINLMFEEHCTDKYAWQLSIIFTSFMRLRTVAKIERVIKGFL